MATNCTSKLYFCPSQTKFNTDIDIYRYSHRCSPRCQNPVIHLFLYSKSSKAQAWSQTGNQTCLINRCVRVSKSRVQVFHGHVEPGLGEGVSHLPFLNRGPTALDLALCIERLYPEVEAAVFRRNGMQAVLLQCSGVQVYHSPARRALSPFLYYYTLWAYHGLKRIRCHFLIPRGWLSKATF